MPKIDRLLRLAVALAALTTLSCVQDPQRGARENTTSTRRIGGRRTTLRQHQPRAAAEHRQ
ncbi:MAG: hypothetical protein WDO12_01420 [Pseudomonadota bacterium]